MDAEESSAPRGKPGITQHYRVVTRAERARLRREQNWTAEGTSDRGRALARMTR